MQYWSGYVHISPMQIDVHNDNSFLIKSLSQHKMSGMMTWLLKPGLSLNII